MGGYGELWRAGAVGRLVLSWDELTVASNHGHQLLGVSVNSTSFSTNAVMVDMTVMAAAVPGD